MGSRGVRRLSAGAVMAGGAAVAAGLLGVSLAYADGTTMDINGWTVQSDSETDSLPFNLHGAPGTLMDPTDALGLGNEVPGSWFSATSPLLDLATPGASTVGFGHAADAATSATLQIEDIWLVPWLEVALVTTGNSGAEGVMALALGGTKVVELLDLGVGPAPTPLVNPDAGGPVTVGGLELASPQDGALLNDLFDAIFQGDTADWGKAATLFGDLLGFDASSAADAVDPGSWLTDIGF